jgi:hypothetical protein
MTDINGNKIKTFQGLAKARVTLKELNLSQNKYQVTVKDIIVNKKLYLQKYYLKYK